MTCESQDPTHPRFNSNEFVSGHNDSSTCADCQNNPDRTGRSYHDIGPLPATDYLVGPDKGFGRRDLKPVDPSQHGRYGMQLHGCYVPATCSNGCIAAIPNSVRDRLNQLLHLEEGHNWLKVVP
jgi:hypothetical protein